MIETFFILTLFILLFSLSYFMMNRYLKKDKYLNYNPFKIKIPQQTIYMIERFGKRRFAKEGFQDYLPLIDEIEAIVSLKEELISPNKLEIFTLDNKRVNLDYRVFYKVTDPIQALNNVPNYKSTLRSLIIISTLNVMSNTRLVNIKTNTIQKIREDIEKKSLNWGIEIPRILFDTISIPQTDKSTL